jgi:hypothetical protein
MKRESPSPLGLGIFVLNTKRGREKDYGHRRREEGEKPSPPRDCDRDEIRKRATDLLHRDWEGAESRMNDSQETWPVPRTT